MGSRLMRGQSESKCSINALLIRFYCAILAWKWPFSNIRSDPTAENTTCRATPGAALFTRRLRVDAHPDSSGDWCSVFLLLCPKSVRLLLEEWMPRVVRVNVGPPRGASSARFVS